jgi:hypothetical protein
VRGDWWQFGHLMPSRIAETVPRVQAARAAPTRLRDEIHDGIHAFRRNQPTMMPRMPRLSPGFASTLDTTTTRSLLTRETIGWRRLWRGRGILLSERELAFEVGNPLGLLGELLAKPFVLFSEFFDLLRLAITRVARLLVASRSLLALRLHQPERSESVWKVQV